MNKSWVVLVALMAAGMALNTAAPAVLGDDGARVRIRRMDNKVIEGELVEELPGAYRVKYRSGIIITIQKNEVREFVRLSPERESEVKAETPAAGRTMFRRRVTDAEIAQILGSEHFDFEDVAEPEEDPTPPLETNEESVAEMLRIAGPKSKKLETDHFVFVYTSERKVALKLASRLEATYRWCVRFMEMTNMTKRRPNYRLEIYFFATYKEYQGYQALTTGEVSEGAIGFYLPSINRSAFFDLDTWPTIANLKEQLKNADWRERQRIGNLIARWTSFENLSTIQHEAAHHIHFNIGVFPRRAWLEGGVPRWLGEGMAQMFEFPPTAAGASLGTTNHARLREYRRIYGTEPRGAGDLRLFIVDDSQWKGADSYPLGWALCHYLWKKKRPQFARYMQLVASREEGVSINSTQRQQEFEDLFGAVDEEWIEDFVEYVNSLRLRLSTLPP